MVNYLTCQRLVFFMLIFSGRGMSLRTY